MFGRSLDRSIDKHAVQFSIASDKLTSVLNITTAAIMIRIPVSTPF
jgi:hypothetical protein